MLERLFADGARVVAVATRPAPGLPAPTPDDERELQLAGLPHLRRPAEARRRRLRSPSSRASASTVKVITGDNGIVAGKVCRDIGLAVDGTLTGAEIDGLDDDALAAAIPGDDDLRARRARSEVAHHQGRAAHRRRRRVPRRRRQRRRRAARRRRRHLGRLRHRRRQGRGRHRAARQGPRRAGRRRRAKGGGSSPTPSSTS